MGYYTKASPDWSVNLFLRDSCDELFCVFDSFFWHQGRKIGRRANKITALEFLSFCMTQHLHSDQVICHAGFKWLILGNFAIWTVLLLEEVLLKCLYKILENANLSLIRMIHTVEAKLIDRRFCWFSAAMLVPIRMGNNVVSPYKAL